MTRQPVPNAIFAVLAAAGMGGVCAANPAFAENLRKSPAADMAAGATTVADRLAIRRFGTQQPPDSGYAGTGFVLPRPGFNGRYPGYGYQDGGINYNDDRLPDNFDLDQYDDWKPYDRDGDGRIDDDERRRRRDRNHRYHRGYRVVGSGYTTVFYNRNPFYRGYDNYWWDPYPYGIDGRLVNGVQPGSQLAMPAPSTAPGQVVQTPPEPETDLEAGRRLMAGSEFEPAVDRLRAHLAEEPDDFAAMGDLVIALAGDGRLDDAAALARLAYDRDPTLATKSSRTRIALDSRELRKTVVRAVRFAHDRESASSWLLVTLLMQAEGRDSVALSMLERAIDRGLPASISDPLSAALR